MEIARFIKEEVKRELKKCLEEGQHYLRTATSPKITLVIEGKCLMYALDPSLRVMLLNLSLNCCSVVCCRVSPLQKAQLSLKWSRACTMMNHAEFKCRNLVLTVSCT